MKRRTGTFVVAVGAMLAVAGPAGADIRIDGVATGHTTLAAALAAAPAGATVEVIGGTYREALTIIRPVTLLGKPADGAKPLIDGGNAPAAISIEAEGVVVDGFAITASGSRALPFGVFSSYSEEACVLVRGAGAVIGNNTVSGCHYGIYMRAVESGAIELNRIEKNRFGGIFVLNSRNVGIRENAVAGNGYNGIGVGSVVFPPAMLKALKPLAGDVRITAEARDLAAVMSADIEIAGNEVSGHGHGGIVVAGAARVAVLSNTAHGNGGAPVPRTNPPVTLGSASDIRGYGIGLVCDTRDSRVADNVARDNDDVGILVDTAYANVVSANEATGNAVGIGLFGATGNELRANTVHDNHDFGIRIERGAAVNQPPVGNLMVGNDLAGNDVDAYDTSGKDVAPPAGKGVAKGGPVAAADRAAPNRWNDETAGNRHSGFDETAEGFVDADGDGIGELPHPIPGGAA
ncbi:MAG TPA: right-handed parallel beta-helix repeat-containing protein, partial [Kaistiaceae bacterium]|nr:right-handed parallel beta-helix repeat-containing protein [Kaistiaceae bacterium]